MSHHSSSYNRKLKKMVELIKGFHPLVSKIPAPLPKPGSEALKTPKMGDAKTDAQRKESYGKVDPLRLDKTVAPYWVETLTMEETRRKG